MPYLNVNEVESALAAAAGPPNAAFTQLLTLPNPTWEGRTCHAIKLASGSAADRIGLYFIGGVHAREWGSCDILIAFVERVANAFRTASGLVVGGKSFTAAQIASIVNNLDVIVFPQVNPDGRNHSMTVDTCWRKNRRPGLGGGVGCTGVDINRNYDFLWDFTNHFSPAAPVQNSTTTCGVCNSTGYQTYIGPSVQSEPETRNVVSIVDGHPNVRVFVDVHSYAQDILYAWGDDEAQSANPTMNFQNPAFDSARGIAGDAAYKEWMPAGDQQTELELANRMKAAIQAAHGQNYTVKSSFALYPTAGTSTDYMFSRHIVDRSKGKIRSFVIEWGTEFQPPYATVMVNVIDEIVAALVDLCLGVLAGEADVMIRDSASDSGGQPSTGVFWESPDIVVRHTDDNVFSDQGPKRGQTNFVYVKVTNKGPAAAKSIRVSLRAARFPGTEFTYPSDWTAVDATHLQPTAVLDTFASVPSGSTRIAKFTLSAAQVDTLWGWQAASHHPCLLAQADCSNDFRPPIGPHVWENNNLAQRNVTVADVGLAQLADFRFVVGNRLSRRRRVDLVVDRTDLPDDFDVVLDPSPEPAFDLGRGGSNGHGAKPVAIEDKRATVTLDRVPAGLGEVALQVRVPDSAAVGKRYRVRVSQLDKSGAVVGGVTAVIHVVKSQRAG
jgi:murein tripeptide amidase MpaA